MRVTPLRAVRDGTVVRMTRRTRHSAVLAVLVAVLLGLCVSVPAGAARAADATGVRTEVRAGRTVLAEAQAKGRWVRRPVLKTHGFADPSVARYRGGYVGVATGTLAPRSRATSPAGPWRAAGTALKRRPRWASSRSVWAGDLVHVGRRWLLYFSAPVRGLGPDARCIGVAWARRPTRSFRPVGRRPLVCPRPAHTRVAGDAMDNRDRSLPHRGVIDPEGYARGRRRYVVYRTQGTPSSIRMVRLTRNGLAVPRGARSRELVRADHIIENPVLVRHGRATYLLASEGSFGDCAYRTTWRRTTNLWSWSRSRARPLLDQSSTGLCGPGGADVVDSAVLRTARARRALVFLHAWTCPGVGTCPTGEYAGHTRTAARRSLYAAWLWWRAGRPRVTSFVVPSRPRPAAGHL